MPPAQKRHPASNPKEPGRKEHTQCEYCWKSRSAEVKLHNCSGCMMSMYCSKECQKNHWPVHKEKCRLNSQMKERMDPSLAPSVKALRAYTAKHRPTLSECGTMAFDLCVDPSRCMRDVLAVFLSPRPRPGSTRPETAFIVRMAEVVPIEMMTQFSRVDLNEFRGELERSNAEQRRIGALGMFFCVLVSTGETTPEGVSTGKDSGINVMGVSFDKEALKTFRPGMPWKQTLMTRMNEGIVL